MTKEEGDHLLAIGNTLQRSGEGVGRNNLGELHPIGWRVEERGVAGKGLLPILTLGDGEVAHWKCASLKFLQVNDLPVFKRGNDAFCPSYNAVGAVWLCGIHAPEQRSYGARSREVLVGFVAVLRYAFPVHAVPRNPGDHPARLLIADASTGEVACVADGLLDQPIAAESLGVVGESLVGCALDVCRNINLRANGVFCCGIVFAWHLNRGDCLLWRHRLQPKFARHRTHIGIIVHGDLNVLNAVLLDEQVVLVPLELQPNIGALPCALKVV